MDNTIKILEEKIQNAKNALPKEAIEAINSVDWKNVVVSMREKRKYRFEQIEILGTEVEKLLYGLLNPIDFSKDLEFKMHLSKTEVGSLINELNDVIFRKIREELTRRINENKMKTPTDTYNPIKEEITPKENEVFKNAGVEITPNVSENIVPEKKIEGEAELLNKIEHPDLIQKEISKPTTSSMTSISLQKLTNSFKIPTVNTDHSENKVQKTETQPTAKVSLPNVDPYREAAE